MSLEVVVIGLCYVSVVIGLCNVVVVIGFGNVAVVLRVVVKLSLFSMEDEGSDFCKTKQS